MISMIGSLTALILSYLKSYKFTLCLFGQVCCLFEDKVSYEELATSFADEAV